MARVSLAGVTRRFTATGAAAVDAVDLTVEDGGFVALLGPSGCGKTTLLRLIAGFERPDAGRIAIGEEAVAGPAGFVPPERRQVGMVFQSFALWPHMTVAGNVGYPLRVAGIRGPEYHAKVAEALEAVSLGGLAARRPAALSGGQRQRVALARCLVMRPRVVLLDEPLASLDPHLRATMQAEFTRFHALTRATMVYVTHDQAEALALADRVAVMQQGRIVQLAAPRDLYRTPGNEFVARFVGGGAVVPARVLSVAGTVAETELLGLRRRLRAAPDQQPGPALACLRPEDLRIAASGAPATVRAARYQGATTEMELDVAGQTVLLRSGGEALPGAGSSVHLEISDGWVIPDGR
jgi:iron(III) transport system ATP-binding protein